MKIFTAQECPQLSDLWWEHRRGLVTASDMDKIMSPVKRKASGSQDKYISQLIADITCLNPAYFTAQGGPVNASVEYGRQTEAEARRWYELETGNKVTEVGGCLSDDGKVWASPDGLIGDEGGLELKCPNRDTHVLYMLKNEVPRDYLMQVHGCLIVTGRPWWDWCSYATGLPGVIKRVVPDELTVALRMHLKMFLAKFEEAKKKLDIKLPTQSTNEITPEIAQAVAAYQSQLAALNQVEVDEAMDRVNSWIDEIKELKKEKPMVAVHLWRTVKKYADSRHWNFDAATLKFHQEESHRSEGVPS